MWQRCGTDRADLDAGTALEAIECVGAARAITANPNKIKRIKNDPNDWYVNLHTPDFPDGAIRGQLKPGG